MSNKERPGILESRVAHFVDAIVAAIIAAALYVVGKEDLAGIAIVVGLLLIVSRFVQSAFIKESLSPLQKVYEIVDLNQKSDVAEIDSLLKAYLSIRENEFRGVKDTVLVEATTKLRRLASEKRSDELGTSEYYSWLLPIIDDAKGGDTISAVSCMFDAEWDDSPTEVRFLKANLDAAQRGAHVERVFIIPEAKLSAALQNEPIKLHTVEVKNKVNGVYVTREYLEGHDPQLLKESEDGFISFSGRVALIDRFDDKGMVRGIVTMNENDIRRLDRVFERLKLHAKPLTQSLQKTLPPPTTSPMKAIEGPVDQVKQEIKT
jgi:hypothetical protein